MSSPYHQHGPGSDPEPPERPYAGCLGVLWALGLSAAGWAALVVLWRICRRAWGA